MAAKAVILIEASGDKVNSVRDAISKVKGIKDAFTVTGPYDVIAIIEGDDIDAIGNIVKTKIRAINGIAKTITCIAVK